MPFKKNNPNRIVSEATLKQCIFWIAYDYTPLFSIHEDIREDKVETIHRSLLHNTSDEPHIISRAKEQLILYLLESRLVATGCEGHVMHDINGKRVSDTQQIDPIHWRYELFARNWDDSTIGHPVPEGSTFISYIHIPTADLFRVFPHSDMKTILAAHENGHLFLDQLPQSKAVILPRQKQMRQMTLRKAATGKRGK